MEFSFQFTSFHVYLHFKVALEHFWVQILNILGDKGTSQKTEGADTPTAPTLTWTLINSECLDTDFLDLQRHVLNL